MNYQRSLYGSSAANKFMYSDSFVPSSFNGSIKTKAQVSNLKLDLNIVFEEAKNTKVLRLNDYLLGDEGAEKVGSFLNKHKHIEILELKGNNITSEGFALICEGLLNNQNIKMIGAEWNQIGSGLRGLEALNEVLSQNNSLEVIDLRNNKINNTLASTVANLIKQGRNLLVIDLRWNELGNPGAEAILAALEGNDRIQTIELSGNNISEELILNMNAKLDMNKKGIKRFPERNTLSQAQQTKMKPPGNEFRYTGSGFGGENRFSSGPDPNFVRDMQEVLAANFELERRLQAEARKSSEIVDKLTRDIDKLTRDLEEERRLRRDCEAKLIKAKDVEVRTIEDMKFKIDGLMKENSILKRDNSVLIDKIANYEEVHKADIETIKALEVRVKEAETDLLKDDELYKLNTDKLISENNAKLLDLEKRMDLRVKELLKENEAIHKRNLDLENEVRSLTDELRNYDYLKTEDIREISFRIREEEKNRQQVHIRKIEADLRKFEDENTRIRRDYESAVSEFNQVEKRLKDSLIHTDEEIRRLKNELSTSVEQYNRERLRSESLANEILLKEGHINKLEAEIRDLQKSMAMKENMNKELLDRLAKEQEDERLRYEETKTTLQNRINDLEKQLRHVQGDLNKLRQDLQRLSDMLITNMTQSVYKTFSEFRLMA